LLLLVEAGAKALAAPARARKATAVFILLRFFKPVKREKLLGTHSIKREQTTWFLEDKSFDHSDG
jgi:hypothetical protein